MLTANKIEAPGAEGRPANEKKDSLEGQLDNNAMRYNCQVFSFYKTLNNTAPSAMCSVADLVAMIKTPGIGPKEEAPALTPYLAAGKTKAHALGSGYYAIIIDHDHDNLDADGIKAIYDPLGIAYIAFTTSNHQQPGKGNRWKVIIFLASPANHDQWYEVSNGGTILRGADPSQARTQQVFFAPNKLSEQAPYECIDRTDRPCVDLSDQDQPFIRECRNAFAKNEAEKDQKALSATPAPRVDGGGNTVIEQVNQAYLMGDVLTERGHIPWGGGKYLSPYSESGKAGGKVLPGNRYYSHHGETDPLSNLNNGGHSLSVFDVICKLDHGGDYHKALAWALITFSPPAVLPEGASLEPLPAPAPAHRTEITYISGRSIMADPRKVNWLVDGFLAAFESTLIHAQGGLGKSMFVLYMLLCMAAHSAGNLPFLGTFPIPKRRCSLMLGAENGRTTTYQRLRNMTQGNLSLEAGLDNIYFLTQYGDTAVSGQNFLDPGFCAFLPEFILDLEERENIKIEALCVDPWISYSGAKNENDAADMRPGLDNLDKACRQVGCTPIVVHHDKKDGQNFRGSSAVNDWCRNRISLKREFFQEARPAGKDKRGKDVFKDYTVPGIRITHEKCNNAAMFSSLLVQMTPFLHFQLVDPNKVDERVLGVLEALKDMNGHAATNNELAKKIADLKAIGQSTARTHIKLATDTGLVSRTSVKGTYSYDLPI